MAARSIISQLPDELRRELDRRLQANGFGRYQELADWLTDNGYKISCTTVHAYGQKRQRWLERISASTQVAVEVGAAAPDDEDARSAAVISMVQTDMFEVLMSLQEATDQTDTGERLKLLANAARAVAELSRASVGQKQWAQQVRAKVEAASAKAVQVAQQGGLSADSVAQIRRAILGIVA